MPLTIVIDLEPNIFQLGPFLITWHGVFAVLGILGLLLGAALETPTCRRLPPTKARRVIVCRGARK